MVTELRLSFPFLSERLSIVVRPKGKLGDKVRDGLGLGKIKQISTGPVVVLNYEGIYLRLTVLSTE